MKLFINNGGIGKRLLPLTKDIPKPMVEINKKPVLHHLIDWAKREGIEEIVMMNGYKAEKIEEYFGDGEKFKINITHSNEPYALGSGGAVKFAERCINARFVYISGDHICDVNLENMIKFHEKNYADLSILVHESTHPEDSDILQIDNNGKVNKFISKYEEYTEEYGRLSNSGLCIIERNIINLMDKEKFNFENYLYPKVIENNLRFFAYESSEFMADMGTFERLERCSKYLKDNIIIL